MSQTYNLHLQRKLSIIKMLYTHKSCICLGVCKDDLDRCSYLTRAQRRNQDSSIIKSHMYKKKSGIYMIYFILFSLFI